MAKIMSVDNDPNITTMVKKILDAEGYEVSIAMGGGECLEMLKKGKLKLFPSFTGSRATRKIFRRVKKMEKLASRGVH